MRLLPRTNCRQCGLPTCMVFAVQAAEGGRGAEECPELYPDYRERLESYLGQFHFD